MSPSVADTVALLAILLLTLLNAFFTLAETALVTVRNARLQQMIAERGAEAEGAGAVQELMRHPTRVGATVQVGTTLAVFGVAALAAAVLGAHLAHTLLRWGIPHPVRVATIALTLLLAFVTIIFGELIPRSVALRRPEQVALWVAGPLKGCILALSWLATFAVAVSNALIKPFGLTATFAAPVMTEEELRALLDAGAQAGAIEEDEKQIIRNVISFGDTEARQVMTPRTDMKAADIETALPEFVRLVVASGHSRIPVYESSVDAILGIVHAKDLLPPLAAGKTDLSLRSVMRAPLFVPENKSVDDLLDEFKRSGTQLAIVQDEYGGTAGLVTVEDLLEELVGEIKDEYDREEPMVQAISPEMSLVDGRMSIADLNEQMGLELPQEDFDTIGGFVFGLFGRQTAQGEAIRCDGVEFVVEKTDGRRIQKVRLIRHPEEEEPSHVQG